ncbi:phosphopantetheine-binding protein [Micromonospora psammae]|uniref:phosphopantetheine-binding protein n=1 Tax=Micromonospora sp. CPCC 205556 TaxID=3122398 RepID=UPI002FF00FDC
MPGTALDPTFEAVVRRHLKRLDGDAPIPPDVPLKDLGLDSMEAVELVFDLEDELDLALPDEAMTAETFASADRLWQAVCAARTRVTAAGS